MTVPRQIIPGATLMLSRRCFDRRMLLRPSEATNELVRYLLAVAAERHGVLLHAVCAMSNHLHIVVTDPLGNLPRFEQLVDCLLARALNEAHGRWESFWAPGSYSAVRLLSPSDVVDKVAYVLANPVKAGLVRRGTEWPGVWAAAGLERNADPRVQRPAGFFRPAGPLPEAAMMVFTCPPGFDSLEVFRDQVRDALEEQEDQAAREVATSGRAFLGARRVMAQNPRARPPTAEPRRGLNPRIAGRDKWKRVEALGRVKAFLAAYREAWCAFATGLRETVFPAGTYWMRVAHGVRCAPF